MNTESEEPYVFRFVEIKVEEDNIGCWKVSNPKEKHYDFQKNFYKIYLPDNKVYFLISSKKLLQTIVCHPQSIF